MSQVPDTQNASPQPQPPLQQITPEDDGSDWFYKLQFICRVLEGNAPREDWNTALGMARSLKNERWQAEVVKQITPEDVTQEMRNAFRDADDGWQSINPCLAAAINEWLKWQSDWRNPAAYKNLDLS